ncbi:hypothetical protein MKX08_000381 [Trichoderma sp. CBMAI-0020]|nr:hypothetical protein MKX08_000381 [Trichoderma sp. CBMAI-0020]
MELAVITSLLCSIPQLISTFQTVQMRLARAVSPWTPRAAEARNLQYDEESFDSGRSLSREQLRISDEQRHLAAVLLFLSASICRCTSPNAGGVMAASSR